MRVFLLCLTAFIFVIAGLPGLADSADGHRLLKIVALSRHGVRAPTQEKKILDSWTQKTWPKWPVKRGELTERGAALVREMWKNLHKRYKDLNLIPENICPRPDLVYVRADVDERTKATARAILQGLAADCDLGFAVLPDAKVDPLFHPLKAGLYQFNAIEGVTDVLAMSHGGLTAVQERLAPSLAMLEEILGPPDAALCDRFAMIRNCTIGDLPNAISISPNGEDIRLVGSLSIASSAAEIFLLEYAEWPKEKAGWGQVSDKILEEILPIHATVFDVVNRAPMVAWAKGSTLLAEMAAALAGSHADARCNEANLVVFVGHDTNIANLGALLGIDWQANGYPENGIPPASLLALELWEINGAREVMARFYAQSPSTLHKPIPKEGGDVAAFAPEEDVVNFSKGMRLPLEEFLKLVGEATKNAPIAPFASPPLDYGKVTPTP